MQSMNVNDKQRRLQITNVHSLISYNCGLLFVRLFSCNHIDVILRLTVYELFNRNTTAGHLKRVHVLSTNDAFIWAIHGISVIGTYAKVDKG